MNERCKSTPKDQRRSAQNRRRMTRTSVVARMICTACARAVLRSQPTSRWKADYDVADGPLERNELHAWEKFALTSWLESMIERAAYNLLHWKVARGLWRGGSAEAQ